MSPLFSSVYCYFFSTYLIFIKIRLFKSNARETWCVILVSASWHLLFRITALYTPFRSAQNHCLPDNVRPRGAFISVGDWTPTEKYLLLLTTCRSGSLNSDWDENLLYITSRGNSRMLRHSCCEVRVMQLHDILQLRTSVILPEAISDGWLAPTTDTSLFLTTYRTPLKKW